MLSLLKYGYEQKAQMKSTQAQRVLLLYRYILDSGSLTVAQAGEYLLSKGLDGISVRTLQRDLNMLLKVMDDICKKSGVGIEGVLYLCGSDSEKVETINVDSGENVKAEDQIGKNKKDDEVDPAASDILSTTTKNILSEDSLKDESVELVTESDEEMKSESESKSKKSLKTTSDQADATAKSEIKNKKTKKIPTGNSSLPQGKENQKPAIDKNAESEPDSKKVENITKKTTRSKLPAGFNKIDKYELQAQKYLKKYSRAKSKNDYQEEIADFLIRNSYDDKSVKISRKGRVTIYLKKLKAKQVIKLMKELQEKLTFE